MLIALSVVAAGCAFEGQITVRLVGDAPAVVKESFKVELTPHSVKGTTSRAKQVVRLDCSVTGVFDVREATGSAVLIQLYVVHLRTRPLPRGTRYAIDCAGPVLMQLPADASAVQAVATDASGSQVPLSVRAPLSAVSIASGKRLRAEQGTRFAALGQPSLAPGGYTVDLTFELPQARTFRQKALMTASVACGRSSYLQPDPPPGHHHGAGDCALDPTFRNRDQCLHPASLRRHSQLRRGDANALLRPLTAERQ